MTEQLADALASAAGGVVTVVVTYPIEIVKNKIASAANDDSEAHDEQVSALSVARDMYDHGGASAFYDGMTVSAAETVVEKFMYFYAYSFLRGKITALRGASMSTDLIAGCVSEIAHLPVTIPLDTLLIKVVNNPQTSALEIAQKLLTEKGVIGLYAGAAPSILLAAKPAIQLAFFEALKTRYFARSRNGTAALSAGMAFVCGAAARALSTLIVFPYQRAKVMLKNMPKDTADSLRDVNPFVGMHLALMHVVKSQGLAGVYLGLSSELVRGVLSAALLMMVRERLTVVVQRTLLRKS